MKKLVLSLTLLFAGSIGAAKPPPEDDCVVGFLVPQSINMKIYGAGGHKEICLFENYTIALGEQKEPVVRAINRKTGIPCSDVRLVLGAQSVLGDGTGTFDQDLMRRLKPYEGERARVLPLSNCTRIADEVPQPEGLPHRPRIEPQGPSFLGRAVGFLGKWFE